MSEWPSKQQEIWFQAGVTGERERIIKLLEELSWTIEKAEHNPSDAYAIDRAIELIKGETK